MRLVVAGASGFIGSQLVHALAAEGSVEAIYALSRREKAAEKKVQWRKVDLADLHTLSLAAKGADVGIYLVHSMSPQARMSQGNFEDFDLLQADNFARACREQGIQDIIYLGGIIEDGKIDKKFLSLHLRSRLEVENTLGAYGARVTAMRAGLILGNGGSSSEMLVRLVKRLPVMLVPSWTMTESEPVDIKDVVLALSAVVTRTELRGSIWEIAGPERLSYRNLMIRVANSLGLKRHIIPLPAISITVSKLWVSLISGAPRELVYPLVKSLTHSMVSREDRRILTHIKITPRPLAETLGELEHDASGVGKFPSTSGGKKSLFNKNTVRSIQRIPNLSPARKKAIGSLADFYLQWLPRSLFGFVKVTKSNSPSSTRIHFFLRFTSVSLLVLETPEATQPADQSTIERFSITGGALQTPNSGGYLEFRWIPAEECGLSIVQDFVPRLPWFIYRFTQAVLHHIVMTAFARAVQRRPI